MKKKVFSVNWIEKGEEIEKERNSLRMQNEAQKAIEMVHKIDWRYRREYKLHFTVQFKDGSILISSSKSK